ncbi:PhzF family phenazine biosynthesis protein [Acidobacteria bacterium AH-259-A15]|nr:PhzF family phenazine biosynthesis protein [Acidobacteria bacterium AH-259-A15]
MKIPFFQVDAFTSKLFSGNPAAVCPLEKWPGDKQLQAIAAENNLSETSFFVRQEDGYELRWFTPTTEIDLCGHATLASAFVIWDYLGDNSEILKFKTRSGLLSVQRREDLLAMSFPVLAPRQCESPAELWEALGHAPGEIWSAGESEKSENYMAVFETEKEVRSLKPNLHLLRQLENMGVIVTAAGKTADFVSRYFAPSFGIPEDPVTGSTHCTLVPYWADRLGKKQLHALQVSSRGGELFCEYHADRVIIAGRAVRYLEGTIYL